MRVEKEIKSGAVVPVEQRMLAEKFGLPGEFARMTKDQFEHAQRYMIAFTDAQIKAGERAATAWDDLKESIASVQGRARRRFVG